MISVSIWRSTLEKHNACSEGLALFASIAAIQAADDPRREQRIRIARWTPLHSLWPYVAGFGLFAKWLEDEGIVPRANLSGANLSGANLSRADLSGANLSRANLSRANLYGAYLSGANLSGANLSRANLYGAYLSGANLYGAYLSGADLSGAYRGASSKIPGWHTMASGYLEKETNA